MNDKNYKLLEMLGNIDDSYINRAEKPWFDASCHQRPRASILKAACAILVITFGMLGVFQPQVNAAVRELFSHIGQLAGREQDFAPYASPMELTQTKDEVTLALQEVVSTDNQLYAAVSIEAGPEYAEVEDFGIRFKELEENIYTSYSGEFLSGSSRENGYVLKYTFEDGTLPEDTDITLLFTVYENRAGMGTCKKIPFEFTFSTSGDQLKQDTLTLSLDQEIEITPGVVLELETLSLNSIFSRIQTKCGEHYGRLSYGYTRDGHLYGYTGYTDYYLKGTDSLGNEVLYTYQAESGPYGHFATEETLRNSAPSPDCQWIELQLYGLDASTNGDIMVPIGEKFKIDMAVSLS